MSLGENLRIYRVINRLNQAQLAERLGCYPSTISKYELNQVRPSQNRLLKLADILNCSVEDLIGSERRLKRKQEKGSWSTLKALRKNKHFSQQQLSEEVGVTQNKISCYERGFLKPENHIVIKLASILDVPVGYLVKKILEEEIK